ncbi:branched-chain amino acid ABC transporter permease [Caballeronia concitans]|uniref:Branched chain amino acid ABC transporter inner membrane protein n=1 Tax=Caballeronia concitans TaxID=1777133 RepID=A0A658QTR2_9BURK|nr:branched-chain amino acid ABC transporter permease [Caballeronia concitans]KIG01930.1 ABC-type transporter, integral membrane subunit [Burkholderia sp. MR1]SAL20575.1 branched chain amino acid ABC transporter inner membrane protein [Caballeronia concitans]
MSFIVNNVQVLFAGLALGSIYALVALGFVLIVRATNVVNFAQGDFAMVGGFAMVAFLSSGLPYWLAFVLALVALGVFGVIFALGVYYPLRNRSYLPVIISTLGASIFMQNAAQYVFGPQPRPMNRLFDKPGIEVGGVFMDTQYLVILGFTAIAVTFQYVLFERTMLGKKLQATSQDKDMARLVGIPVAGMIAFTFFYSAVLGGLAGALVSPILFVSIGMGSIIALKAFAAAIIGGFGDITGAIIGGLLLGVVESFGAQYISVAYKDAFAFLLLFLFLLMRPQGIFGEKISEKA